MEKKTLVEWSEVWVTVLLFKLPAFTPVSCSFPHFLLFSIPHHFLSFLYYFFMQAHSKWHHTKKLLWFSSPFSMFIALPWLRSFTVCFSPPAGSPLSLCLSCVSWYSTLFYYPHNILMACASGTASGFSFVCAAFAQGCCMEALEKSFVFWNALIRQLCSLNQGVLNCTQAWRTSARFLGCHRATFHASASWMLPWNSFLSNLFVRLPCFL